MIDASRVVHICIALDCRRTGQQRIPGRDFICTQCLKACDSASLTKHAMAASRMLAAQQAREAKSNFRTIGAAERAEFVEMRAWGDLRRQVIEKCGVKAVTVEGA